MKRRLLVTRSGRRARVVMLTRFPRMGEVKTRLSAEIGEEAALELHDRLARHTLRSLLALQACREASAEVRTDAAFVQAGREWLGPGPAYRYQGDGDLGARLRLAFADAFRRGGTDRVVVVGSDCPRLSAGHLRRALAALDQDDVVLGPALDGGYYLIGLRRSAAAASGSLFRDMPWGSTEVFSQTAHAARNAGLSLATLEPLPDVDVAADLADAEEALAADRVGYGARVSVIIPTLDEEGRVGTAVRSALDGGAGEVVVADASATQGTAAVATAAGARVIATIPGRSAQMNAGAHRTCGEILCFLHADTVLPAGFAEAARYAFADPATVSAAFDFAVAGEGIQHRIISAAGQIRWRLTGTPYGDQALCMPRQVFEALGGFPEQPAMEDYELASRLKRHGKIARLPMRAVTSARAWEVHGLLWPTLVNATVIAAYRMGAPVGLLARWRRSIAPASGVTGD